MSGGGQMPMASNRGQQMQNPQMGQNQPQGLMPMYPGMAPQSGMMPQMDQMPPQGGMFGGMPMDQMQMQGMMVQMQQAQQMPQYAMASDGMAPALGAGIASLGNQTPYGAPQPAYGGMPMDDNGIGRGLPGSFRNGLPPSLHRPTQGNYKVHK